MSEPSPETHVFIGMFRPPFPEALTLAMKEHKYGWPCSNMPASIPWSHGGVEKCREAWLFGHYDTPVYKTIEEVVRMRADGNGQAAR